MASVPTIDLILASHTKSGEAGKLEPSRNSYVSS
jgi:hypothetical protein